MNFAIAKGPAMEMLSMLKHSLVTNEGSNPITKHFNLVKYSANAGPEMVWKVYDAIRISDKKVGHSVRRRSRATSGIPYR